MKFSEAEKALKAGKKIKLPKWAESLLVYEPGR